MRDSNYYRWGIRESVSTNRDYSSDSLIDQDVGILLEVLGDLFDLAVVEQVVTALFVAHGPVVSAVKGALVDHDPAKLVF